MTLELRFTIPGQVERTVPLDQSVIKIGALLSNQVVLRAPGVDPIHALVESEDNEQWLLTDLGSATGVKINGRHIDVEERLKAGDSITIGSIVLNVAEAKAEAAALPAAPLPPMPPPEAVREAASGDIVESTRPRAGTVRVNTEQAAVRRSPVKTEAVAAERKKDVLFSPRDAKPSGDVLEVVAYWGDTILDVELFHPSYKGYENVTIGDPTKAHLIAAGKSHFDSFTLAAVRSGGYKLNLRAGMQARLRKGGKVEKVEGDGSFTLGARDIAHVKYGAVRYFMMMVRPPSLNLPRTEVRDPFFLGLLSVAFLLYCILIPIAWLHHPPAEKQDKDDIWSIVQVPDKEKPPEKPKPEPKKPEKPPIKVAQKKPPEPRKPPPPKPEPKPVKPATPVKREIVKQNKPVEKPVPVTKSASFLTENKTTPTKNPSPTHQKQQDDKKANSLSKLKGVGMPSTGAKSPDFKLAGPAIPHTALGKSGGVRGSGMNQKGGAIKGSGKASYQGVEGVNNNKASGVNLSKLGLGVGKIMNKTAAGAISTNFKSSAGGAGGGMGSASKTYGLGGVGSGKSLGLAGSGGAVNNFGSGSGGLLSGQGGSGGLGGAGISNAFGGGGRGGHGRANVSVPPGDPPVSGGLTPQEIMAVIRANLNQIRHCYEQLLQRAPNSSGKMGVTFVVGLSGRVTSVRVSDSTISDSRMRGCVTGTIQRWAFPKPRGGQPVTVNYPFVFNPI